MEIPFIPGILILLVFYVIIAKYWCMFADWFGNLIGLKKLIQWLLNKFTQKE